MGIGPTSREEANMAKETHHRRDCAYRATRPVAVASSEFSGVRCLGCHRYTFSEKDAPWSLPFGGRLYDALLTTVRGMA